MSAGHNYKGLFMSNFTNKITLSELLQLIESRTGKPAKPSGEGHSAHCPAHEDGDPSLTISEGTDGTLLLYCHANCKFSEICAALNIEQSDLFPAKDRQPTYSSYPSGTKVYPYKDEQGNLLFKKLRLPGKDFRLQGYDKQGKETNNITGCRKVLYQLPTLLRGISQNKKIYLVEGEKDANTLLKLGRIATTAPTPQLLDEYIETLKNADVVLLYDYDNAGFKKRDLWIQKLYGKVRRLRVVPLPGFKCAKSNGQDITDWLKIEGNSIAKLIEIVENTDDYTPPRNGGGIVVVNFKELLTLEIPKPEILLSPFLWSQGLTLLYAKRGVGKTHMALGIACAVAKGDNFLKWTASKPKKVLYIDGEMSAYSMQARLRKMVNTEDKLNILADNLLIITPDLQQTAMPNLSTEEGRDAIEQIIADRDLIIVDNLSSLFRSGVENEAESWVPIQEWAPSLRRKGKTILFVHHAGKNGLQRGTSKREDTLDVVISLQQADNYQAKEGARFEVHFEKTRHFAGSDAEPFQAQLFIDDNGQALWEISDIDADPEVIQIAEMRKEGKTLVEIMGKTNLTKSQVETRILKAKQSGLFH